MRWLLVFAALGCLAGCTSGRNAPPAPSAVPTTSTSSPVPAPSTRHVTPTRVPATPGTAQQLGKPSLSSAARAAGLVDIRTAIPDAVLDMRYATAQNFVGVQLYRTGAPCLVQSAMVPRLTTAAATLRAAGYRLVFWDCYRPHAVQVRMFQLVPNPDWVARPGPYATSHESGLSVDVTLARDGQQLDMGTGFDDFTARAHAAATDGVSPAAQANRAILRNAMAGGGLASYWGEWWHFDGPGAAEHRPILNVPL